MVVILPLVARPNTGLDGQDDSQDSIFKRTSENRFFVVAIFYD